jgi:hypothetical protein
LSLFRIVLSYAFNRTADFETVGQIKEKFCYVGLDLKLEDKLASETTVLDEHYEVSPSPLSLPLLTSLSPDFSLLAAP